MRELLMLLLLVTLVSPMQAQQPGLQPNLTLWGITVGALAPTWPVCKNRFGLATEGVDSGPCVRPSSLESVKQAQKAQKNPNRDVELSNLIPSNSRLAVRVRS